MMQFKNLSRHPDIGSNSYLLKFGETSFVVDAGTHPKHMGKETLPDFETGTPQALDAIFVSHPHLDHLGALPCLCHRHPEANVFMTEGTKQAGRALLHNSVNVMQILKKEHDQSSYPLYSHRDVDSQHKRWNTPQLRQPFSLGEIDRVRCEFFHAGHVLGAVGIQFSYEGKTVLYSGDVHFEDQTLTRGALLPTSGEIDSLIIEATRGDSPRQADYCRKKEKQRLGEVISETIDQGGAVLLPVFAFGKTQEVVLMLKELMDESAIPVCPVHIGGLSSRMTGISDDHADSPLRRHRGFKILQEFSQIDVLPRGKTVLEYEPGHIYALSSGMMSENTVSNNFAKHILPNPKDTLIFVGYADPETPAGKIQATSPGEEISLNAKSKRKYPLECRVEKFDFSGHAPREQIVEYATQLNPNQVILVHGDAPAKEWLRNAIQTQLPNAQVVVPQPGEELTLA